jgi:assimilatory nitrate reductase catalytic subunit
VASVAIEAAELPWQGVFMAWLPADEALALRERLKPLADEFAFTSCVPFGREPDTQARVGVLLRVADEQAPSAERLSELADLVGLQGPTVLRYDDAARGHHRWLRVQQDREGAQHLRALMLAGDTRADAWLPALLQADHNVAELGSLLLHPGAIAPVKVADTGKQICTCYNVTEPQIVAHLHQCQGSPDARLASLQGALKCGTNCGSCVPTLRTLVRDTPFTDAPTVVPIVEDRSVRQAA